MLYTTMKCPLLEGSCAQSETVVMTITSISQYSINHTELTCEVNTSKGLLIPYNFITNKEGGSCSDIGT